MRCFSFFSFLITFACGKVTIVTRIPTDSISHTPSQAISPKEFNFTIVHQVAFRQTINIRIRSFLKPNKTSKAQLNTLLNIENRTMKRNTTIHQHRNLETRCGKNESNSARKQLTRVQAKTIVQLAAWFFRPIYRPKVRFNPLTLFSANPLLATCAFRVSLD